MTQTCISQKGPLKCICSPRGRLTATSFRFWSPPIPNLWVRQWSHIKSLHPQVTWDLRPISTLLPAIWGETVTNRAECLWSLLQFLTSKWKWIGNREFYWFLSKGKRNLCSHANVCLSVCVWHFLVNTISGRRNVRLVSYLGGRSLIVSRWSLLFLVLISIIFMSERGFEPKSSNFL